MKRYFTLTVTVLIVTLLLLVPCLNVSAAVKIPFSADLTHLQYNNHLYCRFDASLVDTGSVDHLDCTAIFSSHESNGPVRADMQINEYGNVIFADIWYSDGACLSVSYLRDDYLSEYDNLVNIYTPNTYIVDFMWPEGNRVEMPSEAVSNHGTFFTNVEYDLDQCDVFPVLAQSHDGSLSLQKGILLFLEDGIYYAPFSYYTALTQENYELYTLSDLTPFSAHPVISDDSVAALNEAYAAYTRDAYGFLWGDNVGETVSLVFFTLVFAVLPLALFVVFLILARRSRHPYRELCAAVCVFAVAVILVFALVTLFLL